MAQKAQVALDTTNPVVVNSSRAIDKGRESRQDTETLKNKQGSAGFGASICIPPFCYGSAVTADVNLALSNMKSDYKSVLDQSGFMIGGGGYNIDVTKTTVLQGGLIASTASADKNLLSTDRLVYSDIKNKSEIETKSAGISLSYSSGAGMAPPGGAVPLALKDSDTSTTLSAIGEATILVRSADGANDLAGLSRNTANANRVLDKPDQKKIEEQAELIQSTVALGKGIVSEVVKSNVNEAKAIVDNPNSTKSEVADAKAYINSWSTGGNNKLLADIVTGVVAAGLGHAGAATSVGLVANTTAADTYTKIGDYSNQQYALALHSKDSAAADAWAEGGSARVLLHTLAGALQGLSGASIADSAIGSGISAMTAPFIAEQVSKLDISLADKKTLIQLTATAVGGTLGKIEGATYALQEIRNNYLKHVDINLLSDELKKCSSSDTACRTAVVVHAKQISSANDKEMQSCPTIACLDKHIADAIDGTKFFDQIYAADAALDNRQKTAFASITDAQTQSLLLAANMAAGFQQYEKWSDENCGNDSVACHLLFVDTAEKGGFVNSQAQAGGVISRVINYSDFVSSKQPHEYQDLTNACVSGDGVSCGGINEQFDAVRRYPGPGAAGTLLVESGTVSELHLLGLRLGYVTHLVDFQTNSVVNITVPGMHTLDPGFVVRTMIPDSDGGFSVYTAGWGTGSSTLFNSNVWLAPAVWGINTKTIGREVGRYNGYVNPWEKYDILNP